MCRGVRRLAVYKHETLAKTKKTTFAQKKRPCLDPIEGDCSLAFQKSRYFRQKKQLAEQVMAKKKVYTAFEERMTMHSLHYAVAQTRGAVERGAWIPT